MPHFSRKDMNLMLTEIWEYAEDFPLAENPLDEIHRVTHFDGDYSVETWILSSGIIVNYLMGRFGSFHKDIKAKVGYATLEDAIEDVVNLLD